MSRTVVEEAKFRATLAHIAQLAEELAELAPTLDEDGRREVEVVIASAAAQVERLRRRIEREQHVGRRSHAPNVGTNDSLARQRGIRR